MPVLDEELAGAGSGGDDDYSGRHQRCSCLPFCFWGTKPPGAAAKRRRRRRKLRLRIRLSWLAWPWFFLRKGGGGKQKGAGGGDGESKGKKKKRGGKRLMLLLTASLQPKKALASVVSGDSALLPAKVSSFGDAKKQNNRKPRTTTTADGAASEASTTAAAASTTRWSTTSTAPARARPEMTSLRRNDDGPAVVWRAPSRRHSSHHQLDFEGTGRPRGGGMWTAAATLGVIVLFGRVTAVVFLCSCLYGARFVRVRAAGAKAKSSGIAGGSSSSSSRRFSDAAGVAGEKVLVAEPPCAAEEECRKKVVMAGFLDRAGKAPSSRFGRTVDGKKSLWGDLGTAQTQV
ncbi:unnamed protein product [Urochloa humidicola]